MIRAGILDDELNITTGTDYLTIVLPLTADDPYSRTSTFTPVDGMNAVGVSGRPFMWKPLEGYTTAQILESAAEEGLGDIMTMIFNCSQDRPYHCGQCTECIHRRHAFIQAGIEDNTIYECR